jgi:lysophospholipase L1-like esterase
MQAGPHDYAIATNLPPGPHLVELYKRTETQTGTTQFLGFDFEGGMLLPPPLRKMRRIEIIGDSQPAAFGVEGLDYPELDCPGVDHGAQWENFRKSFGARLGEIFDAEIQGTVYSGKGFAQNIWVFDPDTMPVLYPRAIPVDKTSAWDAAGFVPDVILIMMGGNDFAVGKPEDHGPATVEAFTNAYRSFVASLRGTYPKAPIVFAVSPSVKDYDPQHMARTWIKQGVVTVTNERTSAGDTLVSWTEPAVATPEELTGCNGHGNPAFHQRVAVELSAIVREKTGWP